MAMGFLRRLRFALGLVAALLAGPGALAVQPGEELPDPALENRAREISAGLRCLVCQNQSIDDSDAPLARDLRLLVRERLKAGDSDEAVREFVHVRYGDFVLLKPPFKLSTLLLWMGPFLLLIAGGFGVYRLARTARVAEATSSIAPLSEEEKQRLATMLERDKG
jgi:cytochrome c-type biogenesis protein CcmH